jgi:hypothetical protein
MKKGLEEQASHDSKLDLNNIMRLKSTRRSNHHVLRTQIASRRTYLQQQSLCRE